MNVYDKAYDLVRALKESNEYKVLKQAHRSVAADADSKRMLDEFRGRQLQLQNKMMSGQMPPQDEMESMQKLYEMVSLNPAVHKLFDAERRLSVIMEDVQRILAEPMKDLFPQG